MNDQLTGVAKDIGINASADIIDARLPIAEYILKTAGSMLVDCFHHTLRTEDYVNQLIKAIEALTTKNILQSFPEDGYRGLSGLGTETRNGIEWIIDPLDGKHNFLRGVPICGVQIAIKSHDELLYAAMYQPFTQEQETATRGLGAIHHDFRSGQELTLKVSDKPLAAAYLIYDGPIGTQQGAASLELLNILGRYTAASRVYGSALQDFSMVASGRAEAFITTSAKPEDVAPGMLIAREAGGVITDFTGQAVTTASRQMLISNGVVHEDILKLIKGRPS